MTSRTGNKAGFTLIEVMVATAVLAGGVVLIFEALFSTTNTFSYYSSRLALGPWMDQKIWEVSEASLTDTPVETTGTVTRAGKEFAWEVSQNVEGESGLTKLGLEVSWLAGKRQVRLQRGTFVFVPKEKDPDDENG